MHDAEIRDRFREGTLPRGEIDVDAVLRRARARRRPRVLLAGAGGVLAVAGIAVPATLSSSVLAGGDTSGGQAADAPYLESEQDAAGTGETALRPGAQSLDRCMSPVTEIAPAASGLLVTVAPVSASAADRDIPVTVTLTNAGDERITGTTGARPSLTLAQDGITLWHTNGPEDLSARVVDLAPGQSMSYPASFDPVRCDTAAEQAGEFPADLPPLAPGTYRLSAVIPVTSDDGMVIEIVGGPAADVVLR